jgi:diguanylate cyclase (GGDEF)-like protein
VLRVEALAMAMVLLVFALSLVRLWLLPGTALLSVTYLAIILVGSGLFLPWSARWHGVWLMAALAMAAALAALLPDVPATTGGRALLVASLALASVVSFFGHGLWQVRLRDLLEQQFAVREMSRYAQRAEAHVSTLNRELNRVARRDPLTGVGNRLALDEALARLLDQGDRLRPQRFALVLFDIDQFKPYNDAHGHLAGDAALGRLGEALRRAVRNEDLAFRYGGEEFLLLLPGIDLPTAIGIAERVRMAVAEDPAGEVPPFTISGGVALCDPADGRDPGPLLRRADAALYQAKRAGRDRVAADPLSVAMQRETLASAG